MKVFLSWSGSPSQGIAEVLHQWLPSALPGVEPWLSKHDIEKGARWHRALGKQLEETNFGIFCVTPDNVDSPWMVFEAGAIGKYVDQAHVAPVLFGLAPGDVDGPLGQFQCTLFEEGDVLQLLDTMAREMDPPPTPLWRSSYSLQWRALRKEVELILRESEAEDDEEADEFDDEAAFVEGPDGDEDEILTLLAELPDRKGRDWIDVDDVVRLLRVGTRVAEYHLDRLERCGLVDEGEEEDVWFLSKEGLRYVVEEGLVE